MLEAQNLVLEVAQREINKEAVLQRTYCHLPKIVAMCSNLVLGRDLVLMCFPVRYGLHFSLLLYRVWAGLCCGTNPPVLTRQL